MIAPLLSCRTNLTWTYRCGAVRWRRARQGEVVEGKDGSYTPTSPDRTTAGWNREVFVLHEHPVTHDAFLKPQVWIKETKL